MITTSYSARKLLEASRTVAIGARRARAFPCATIIASLPEQYHLAVSVRFGFEQDGVHAHIGDAARGERLKVLRLPISPSATTRALLLMSAPERRHCQALPRVPACQGGCQQAFAGAVCSLPHTMTARARAFTRGRTPRRFAQQARHVAAE